MFPAVLTQPVTLSPPLSLEHLLRGFFTALESHGLRYCILHGYDHLPSEVTGDLDLAVHEDDAKRLPLVLRDLLDDGYFLLQYRNYAVHGHRFDFGWFDAGELRIVGMDVIFEFRYAGARLLPSSQYMRHRTRIDGVWFASKQDQFAYLLAKRALKGSIDLRQQSVLRRLVSEIGTVRSALIADSVFGNGFGEKVVGAIEHENVSAMLPRLAGVLRSRSGWLHPISHLRYWVPEWRRRWSRWCIPTGLLVVVLGPDGCGKNTVVERIGSALREAFRAQHHFHWRPGALVPLKHVDGPEPFPHGRERRGAVLSALYAAVFQLDYWVGYWTRIYPALARSGLVFFNRYHYDMQVDTKRYRYGGPQWLIQIFSRLLPGHPLVLVLDGDPDRIFHRKPELSIAELERQRIDYRLLAGRLKHAFIIDANLPPAAVAREALLVISEYLTRRNLANYPSWFPTRVPSE